MTGPDRGEPRQLQPGGREARQQEHRPRRGTPYCMSLKSFPISYMKYIMIRQEYLRERHYILSQEHVSTVNGLTL